MKIELEIKKEQTMKNRGGWSRRCLLFSNGKRVIECRKENAVFYFPNQTEANRFCDLFFGVISDEFLNQVMLNFRRYSFNTQVLGRV